MDQSLGSNSRKLSNQSAMDRLKKKRKKKKKTKEGKRSSASSASASGSPDSSGMQKTQASYSSPSILEQSNTNSIKQEITRVNECLRWPAHSLYQDNAFRSEIVGKFPSPGATEEEEQERIEIYKMNRRKRYIAAQQALIDKYPDVAVYVSSSGSNSSQDVNNDDGLCITSSRSNINPPTIQNFRSANGSPDSKPVDNKFFSNDVGLALSKNKVNGILASAPKRDVLSV